MRRILGWLSAIAVLIGAGIAAADDASFPSRPIRIIVAFSPGASDAQIRVIAPIVEAKLGQPVVIENAGGGGGALAANRVQSSTPDGYTLLFMGASALTVLPALHSDLRYTVDEFTPIGNISENLGVVVTSTGAPYKTMPELVAFAKANPFKLNFGSAGVGTASHTFGVGAEAAGGFRLTHIPYKGMAEVMTAILGGTVDVGFGLPSLVVPYIRSGTMRPLAVTGATRSEFFPDVPTYREVGVDYVDGENYGLVGPKGVPSDVVQRLASALGEAVRTPEFQGIMQKTFTSIRFFPPDQYRAFLEERAHQWRDRLADPTFRELMAQ